MIWELTTYTDITLLALRFAIAVIFIRSGLKHLKNPVEMGERTEIGTTPTIANGLNEVVAGTALALGVFTQIAAILLAIVMVGAIIMKVFKWNIGFFGNGGSGWHYDFLILAALMVIFTTGGGDFTVT